MPVRSLRLILPLLALPSLWGCGEPASDGPPPPSAEAQAAIHGDGGAPHDELGRAIDGLFNTSAVGATQALVIMKRGSVIAERYAPDITAKTRLPGWSAGQCLTTLMIGQLVSDGRLRLDESAPVPEWRRPGDPRGEVTLKQLVQMRSGLRHESHARDLRGTVEEQSDSMRTLYLDGRDDMAAYAEAQPLVAPAGQVFEDSGANAIILSDLAARVLAPEGTPDERREAVMGYLQNRVLNPIGMTSTRVGFDRAGTMIGAGMIHATARDWAKLAEFLRKNGSIGGAQILPRRWITFMRSPSPRNEAYGAGLWLNAAPPGDAARLWPGRSPANVFACLGEYGQFVVGSPDQLLTVVRLGRSDTAQEREVHERIGALLALFPGGK
ncbi:beta-lactamase family protein [Novosphingobium sp. 1949]|uniref:Beta-lactamase family protein n=1 Tax=Novosphingobium organovorum TaxID=2930092 RepID=A0ABT0BEZ2_9SPHN|nr:serine hydrolase [Novosphingobium organovorum]MCJ2183628.1 beta-lactamase family protein [Novosphingobium organovorum]